MGKLNTGAGMLVVLMLLGITVYCAPTPHQNLEMLHHLSDSDQTESLSGPAEENNKVENLFEGDMILTPEQKQLLQEDTGKTSGGVDIQRRNFYRFSKPWPGNIVSYHPLEDTKDGNKKWRDAIKAGMRHLEKNTCIRFKKTSSGNRLKFKLGDGCNSFVGMRKNENPVTLGMGCLRLGTVAHEIMHALGFVHEQSRPDRDRHVTIIWDNIKPAFKHDFKKWSWDLIDTENVAYDVGSVLHYSHNAFAIDAAKSTIIPNDMSKSGIMGQRVKLSKADIQLVNSVYKCPSAKYSVKPSRIYK